MRALPLVVVSLLAVANVPVLAVEDLPVGPVLNGAFELAAHPLREPLCAAFGDESVNVLDPESGLPWLVSVSPCHAGAVKAAGWSSGATTDVHDVTRDGDREVRFIAGSCDPNLGCGHNLWQAYANPHQVWTGDHEALVFSVESGVVPASASIILSFSTSPWHAQHPFVGPFVDCQLTLTGMRNAGPGPVSLDPTQGVIRSRYVACDDLDAAWNAPGATAEERHEILRSLRPVQHSYWNWNKGPADVVIDDIAMVGAVPVPLAPPA